MSRVRPPVVLLAMLLVMASCGDDDAGVTTIATTAGITTSSDVTDGTTTTGATIPPTTPVDTRALAGMDGVAVEDPFYGSGFHAMDIDPAGSLALSQDPIAGADPNANRLGVGTLDPYPAVTGVTPDLLLLTAWVEGPSPDVLPTPSATVLYGPGGEGWTALAAITDTIVLEYLETTTDYAAWKPVTGVPYARTSVSSLDWSGGAANFVADVQVLDYPGNTHEFLAEVECTLQDTLACLLLSDDGVLRPGDEGEAVEALQLDLIALGYLTGPADGKFGPGTEGAVKKFQRDYRLARDGKVGPQTLELIDDIVSGTSNIVLASKTGVGTVLFGTAVGTALPALTAKLGPPDYSVGWEMGPCGPTPPYGGWEWYKVTWGGFTAWFTERSGSRHFDGWEVTDLATVPSNVYFAGGIAPSWTWSDLVSAGALYDSGYGWWYAGTLGYGMGTFVNPPSNPPAGSAEVRGFATGTGAILYDC